jgi:hypothetical protein
MIIVVTATTQIVATRVIFRIANLLPRPEPACRDAGNGKFIAMAISGESASSPGARWTGGGNDTCELLHTLKKFLPAGREIWSANREISSRLAQSSGSDGEAP